MPEAGAFGQSGPTTCSLSLSCTDSDQSGATFGPSEVSSPSMSWSVGFHTPQPLQVIPFPHVYLKRKLRDAVKAWQSRPAGDSVKVSSIHPTIL